MFEFLWELRAIDTSKPNDLVIETITIVAYRCIKCRATLSAIFSSPEQIELEKTYHKDWHDSLDSQIENASMIPAY